MPLRASLPSTECAVSPSSGASAPSSDHEGDDEGAGGWAAAAGSVASSTWTVGAFDVVRVVAGGAGRAGGDAADARPLDRGGAGSGRPLSPASRPRLPSAAVG